MMKISAVVDSGAEAKCASRDHDSVDCTEAEAQPQSQERSSEAQEAIPPLHEARRR